MVAQLQHSKLVWGWLGWIIVKFGTKTPVTRRSGNHQPTTPPSDQTVWFTRRQDAVSVGVAWWWTLVVEKNSFGEFGGAREASFRQQEPGPEGDSQESKNKITDVTRMEWTWEDRRRWRKARAGPDHGRSYRLFYNFFIWMRGKTIARIWEVKDHLLGWSKCLRKDSEPSGPSVPRD